MNKKERFIKAFNYLRGEGVIERQQDVAEAMQASRSNVSSALQGDEKVLTDKFLTRFTTAFPGVFDLNWMLTGEGEMLIQHKPTPSQSTDFSSYMNAALAAKDETIAAKDQVIDSQRRDLATKDALIKSLQETNKDLRARIYELEHADDYKKYPFEVGVSDPTDQHQPTV